MSFFSKKKDVLLIKNSNSELKFELLSLFRKKFNFYTQFKVGQLKEIHVLKKIRREIARKKFYLSINR